MEQVGLENVRVVPVVDVLAALTARGFSVACNGEIRFSIHDDLIRANNGPFRVESHRGYGGCSPRRSAGSGARHSSTRIAPYRLHDGRSTCGHRQAHRLGPRLGDGVSHLRRPLALDAGYVLAGQPIRPLMNWSRRAGSASPAAETFVLLREC